MSRDDDNSKDNMLISLGAEISSVETNICDTSSDEDIEALSELSSDEIPEDPNEYED